MRDIKVARFNLPESRFVALLTLLIGFFTSNLPALAQQCTTTRASVSTQGQAGTNSSWPSRFSYDGRYLSFYSDASNLVPGDTNQKSDAFLRDRLLGTTERVSLTHLGGQITGGSYGRSVSDDGRFVQFLSHGDDVHPDDPDILLDVYLRDRQAGTTELISERLPGTVSTQGCGTTHMSADGRFVAFSCGDDNVVPGDTNGGWDVFLKDRQSGLMELVSIDGSGVQGGWPGSDWPEVSDDGRYVVFRSFADNWMPGISTNNPQIWLRDRIANTLTLVSRRPDGQPATYPCGQSSISGDGRHVAFDNAGDDLVAGEPPNGFIADVYVRDMVLGVTEFITYNKTGGAATAGGERPMLSRNGNHVAFESWALDLVAIDGNRGIRDIFVRGRSTKVTTLVSVGDKGQAATQSSLSRVVSGDGQCVAWTCLDNMLVSEGGFEYHAYVRDCQPDTTTVYCASVPNSKGCMPLVLVSGTPSASQPSGYTITCKRLVSKAVGILYYGTNGTWAVPFQTGYQCVKPTTVRTPAASTGGAAPPDCTGQLAFDFNAWIAAGNDPSLQAGTSVYGQFWSRDTGANPPTHLSPAVAFVLQP